MGPLSGHVLWCSLSVSTPSNTCLFPAGAMDMFPVTSHWLSECSVLEQAGPRAHTEAVSEGSQRGALYLIVSSLETGAQTGERLTDMM